MAEGQDERYEFVYLDYQDALEIFAAIIGSTAQQAADQLRSPTALEGALGRPASYAHYEQADLPLQAAVLAHGIAQAQAFIDGNKRVALVSMLTFLELNGHGVRRRTANSPTGSSVSALARHRPTLRTSSARA